VPIDEALRQTGIGGSEIAAVLDCDERRDRYSLWRLKRGELMPEPPTPRMMLGRHFERGILEYYAELTGRELDYSHSTTERHPTRPWMVYTVDALVKNERRGVDAKLVSIDQRFRWGATADDIPAHIQAQAWWYMAALDYDCWDIAAVVTSGDPMFYTIERDQRVECAMLTAAEDYWRRYLVGDEIPEPGASLETARYLKEAYPQHFGERPARATAEQAMLLEEYAQARLEKTTAEIEKRSIENRLKAMIGLGVGLEWERGIFTWKTTRDRVSVDWKALAESLMQGFSNEDRAAHRSAYAETKPGARRIHFRCDGADLEEDNNA
jgi:predicted phage-related endonuclease